MSRTPLALLGSIVVILSLGGAFMVTAVTGIGCDDADASTHAVCRSDSARLSLDIALAVVVGSAIALSAIAYVRRSWRLLWVAAVVGIGGIFLAAEVPNAFDLVELVDHDPTWLELFEEERLRLAPIFDGAAVAIEHVGSTAVSGLCAKPIVDVLVGVGDLALTDDQLAAMAELGYEYKGEYGLPGRLFFVKEPLTHHVHVVEHDGYLWERQLVFRDSLRTDPDERERYDELKRRLAAEGHPRSVYAELKTPFIREVEARGSGAGHPADRPSRSGAVYEPGFAVIAHTVMV